MIKKNLFTADEVTDGKLVWMHNLNTEDVMPTLFDNTGRQVITIDLFSLGDPDGNNKANAVTLYVDPNIPGTWTLLLNYETQGSSGAGKRLFELSEENNPTLDFRFALGKALTPSKNITLNNLVAWLFGKLNFAKRENNLSDLSSIATARDNLGVYAKSAVDTAIAAKASLYQAESGAALGTANTAIYTPYSNYHPATVKFVFDNALRIFTKGSYHVGDVDGSGHWEGDITIPDFGSTNYVVLGELYDSTGNPSYWIIKSKTNTSFKLHIGVRDNSAAQDIYFNFVIAYGSI